MRPALECLTNAELMERLCNSFPALRGVPGTAPWDQRRFAKWASGGISTAERLAAAFVLSVWNGGTPADGGWWNQKPYHVGRFDVVNAFGRWDSEQQAAFLAWCADPFWP